MRKRIVILVIVLVGAAGWAQSTMGTGQWLYGLWPSTQKAMTNQPMTELEDWNSGIFAGFVQGAAQVMWDADWLELTGTTYAQWGAVSASIWMNTPSNGTSRLSCWSIAHCMQ
jgi:hypothetical protein